VGLEVNYSELNLGKTTLRLTCGIVIDTNVSEEPAVSIFRVEEWWIIINFLEKPAPSSSR
jgi:hypothetical protein